MEPLCGDLSGEEGKRDSHITVQCQNNPSRSSDNRNRFQKQDRPPCFVLLPLRFIPVTGGGAERVEESTLGGLD